MVMMVRPSMVVISPLTVHDSSLESNRGFDDLHSQHYDDDDGGDDDGDDDDDDDDGDVDELL